MSSSDYTPSSPETGPPPRLPVRRVGRGRQRQSLRAPSPPMDKEFNPYEEPDSPEVPSDVDESLPDWLPLPPKDPECRTSALIYKAHKAGIRGSSPPLGNEVNPFGFCSAAAERKYHDLMPGLDDYPPCWPGPKPTDPKVPLKPEHLFTCELPLTRIVQHVLIATASRFWHP